MSHQASRWVDSLPYDVAERLETRVLLKLADVADPEGRNAFRSKTKMATELGCDPKSVARAFRKLVALDLIRLGDQRLTAHLRGGYRPTVYDLNLGWHRMYSQPELLDIEPEDLTPEPGGTGLSTSPEPGGMSGGTSEVPLGTGELNLPRLNKEPYVPERARSAHEQIDASGAPIIPLSRWQDERCPASLHTGKHEQGTYGHCVHCFEKPLNPRKGA